MINIAGFSKARILVVGDVMLDRYCWGTVNRISPEAPVPIVRLDRETVRPGGAANVAANAGALGARVKLVGIVGNDPSASDFRSAVRDLGIEESGLVVSDTRRTIIKTRILAHGQQVVRLDSEDVSPISQTEGEKILKGVRENVSDVDLVILSDYGKGLLDENIVGRIIEISRAFEKPVLADPKGKHFDKYLGATVLTPNRREAAEACKIEESDPNLVQNAGERLLVEFDLDSVLVTESENGMTLFQKGKSSLHFGTAAREVFDVTGAGDTVIACLGVALAAGLPIAEAAWISNVAAGLSVQHIGTVAVPFEELEGELRRIDKLPVT